MRYMMATLLVFLAFLPGRSFASEPLTPRQHALLARMVENDLSIYLQGGEALLQGEWSKVAVPWETDQQIGMRYSGGNALSADSFYGHKTIFIRGLYLSAENWVDNDYRVQLNLVAAIVDKPDAAFLENARNNTRVEMACKAGGLEFDTTYVEDCMSPSSAISILAIDEVNRIASSPSKDGQNMRLLVRIMDAGLSADDPCRVDMTGCGDKLKGLLEAAAEKSKKGDVIK